MKYKFKIVTISKGSSYTTLLIECFTIYLQLYLLSKLFFKSHKF